MAFAYHQTVPIFNSIYLPHHRTVVPSEAPIRAQPHFTQEHSLNCLKQWATRLCILVGIGIKIFHEHVTLETSTLH